MSRIIVEVSSEQQKVIKALAAIEGKSIKDYVLERILPPSESDGEANAWNELKAILQKRIHQAEIDGPSKTSVSDVAEQTLRKLGKI